MDHGAYEKLLPAFVVYEILRVGTDTNVSCLIIIKRISDNKLPADKEVAGSIPGSAMEFLLVDNYFTVYTD